MNNLSIEVKKMSGFSPTYEDKIASQKFLNVANRIAGLHKECMFKLTTKRAYENSNGKPVFQKEKEVKIQVCKDEKWKTVGYYRPVQTILLRKDREDPEEALFKTLRFNTEITLVKIGRSK